MSWTEAIATLFGLLCVGLYVRRSVWSWPTGLVQVTLYVWVFWEARLYSDVLLHLVYIGLSLYGWWRWVARGPDGGRLRVSRLTPAAFGGWLLVAAAGTAALGGAMARWTDAALPFWDAAIAALSLVAQLLIARKVLESWLLWIAVDVLGIGVYGAKALYLTCGLYAVFLGMAVTGWFAWRKAFREGEATTACAAAAASSSASSCPRTAGISSSSTSRGTPSTT